MQVGVGMILTAFIVVLCHDARGAVQWVVGLLPACIYPSSTRLIDIMGRKQQKINSF